MGKNEELPWDLFDRCLLPVVFSHAAAVILSTVLNSLYISQVSTFTLFLWFVVSSLGAVLFYHNLKVKTYRYNFGTLFLLFILELRITKNNYKNGDDYYVS
jgi:hypothetical protein